MIGTFVNAGAVIAGGIVGMIFNKSMPERFKSIYFQAVGLFTIAMGVSMVYNFQHILIVVSSLAIGSLLGEWMNLEKGAEQLGDFLKRKLRIGNDKFSEGLVTAFLLFCIGSMTIVGAINEGIGGSSEVLLTKSIMDGFSSIILASAFGVGVVLSFLPLLLFQGGLTLLAMYASSFFTTSIIQGLTAVGGILLIGLGINILEIKRLRIMNMLPSLFVVVLLLYFFK